MSDVAEAILIAVGIIALSFSCVTCEAMRAGFPPWWADCQCCVGPEVNKRCSFKGAKQGQEKSNQQGGIEMRQYLNAVRNILENGTRKENRTGVDTISTFGEFYECDLRDGFPLLTTKKISWKNIVVENLWFLSGEPHIGILQKHGCKFWDAWADKDGFVPSAYGNFWRRFPVHPEGWGSRKRSIAELEAVLDGDTQADAVQVLPNGQSVVGAFNDQIAWMIDELKRNPMSRRLVTVAWAPGNAQTSKLPPCHVMMVLNVQNLKCGACKGTGKLMYPKQELPPEGGVSKCNKCSRPEETRPHLCLHLTQRSCDIALGVPYNIAGYAFLLELFARFADLPAGIFAHTLVDAHAYTCKPDGSMADMDHVPGLKEQLTREPRRLPALQIHPSVKDLSDISRIINMDDTEEVMEHFVLFGYEPHPAIKFRVAV